MNAGHKIAETVGRSAAMHIVALLVALFLLSEVTSAQEQAGTTKPVADKGVSREEAMKDEPVDLAHKVLTGSDADEYNPAFNKRPAETPNPPTEQELSETSVQDRELDMAIPLRGYPEPDKAVVPSKPVYARASLGLYMTGMLSAGYSGSSWPYDYFASLDMEGTEGFVDNGSRSSLGIKAGGGYVIGEDYGLFSGGYMGTELGYSASAYQLYPLANTPTREWADWHVAMTGSNTYKGVSYDARGAYRAFDLTDSIGQSEGAFEGMATLGTMWSGLKWEGGVDTRITSVSGKSISFGKLHGGATYSNGFMALRGGMNFGIGANSIAESSVRFAPTAELQLYPLEGVTLSGELTSGLTQTTLQGLMETNQYTSTIPEIRHEDERLGYGAMLRIEPSERFAMRISGARKMYDTYMYYTAPIAARFAPAYNAATVTSIVGDSFWKIDAYNEALVALTFTEGELAEMGEGLPYVPKWDGEVAYTHTLTKLPVAITGSLRYIGPREASEGRELGSAVLIGIQGTYRIHTMLDGVLELRNLANQRYELWEGYRERGIFLALGVQARL